MMLEIALLHLVLLQSASTPVQEQAAPAAKVESAPEAEKPLPDVKQLLADVETNEKRSEKLRDNYTYHVHMEEEEYDGSGKVKKTEVTDSESVSIDGIRVDRVVAKDGKPLTDEEKKKEDEKVDKEVAHGKQRRDELVAKGQASADHGEALMPAARFLELGTFSNERREMFEGRPTIVMDYAGDPKAKTKTEFEGIVRDLVGVVWVDEADHALVQLEGHFLKDFKVGAGLIANVHGGTHFTARMQKVNDEVWLPAEVDGVGTARFLLFVKIDGKMKMVTSDYRKYRTGATIKPSYREIGPDGKVIPDAQGQQPTGNPPIKP